MIYQQWLTPVISFSWSNAYDPALFHTSEEYEQKTKRKVDLQTIVESPEMCVVAKSSSSYVEQLSYVHPRLDCLEEACY